MYCQKTTDGKLWRAARAVQNPNPAPVLSSLYQTQITLPPALSLPVSTHIELTKNFLYLLMKAYSLQYTVELPWFYLIHILLFQD